MPTTGSSSPARALPTGPKAWIDKRIRAKSAAAQFRRDDRHAQRLGPDGERRIEKAQQEQAGGRTRNTREQGDESDSQAGEQLRGHDLQPQRAIAADGAEAKRAGGFAQRIGRLEQAVERRAAAQRPRHIERQPDAERPHAGVEDDEHDGDAAQHRIAGEQPQMQHPGPARAALPPLREPGRAGECRRSRCANTR